jgi:hypothetical protein
MTTSRTLTCTVAVERGAKGRRRLVAPPLALPAMAPGRVPRVARLLALAHQFEGLLRQGVVRDYVMLARLGHVSRVHITHIMNLLQLAPDIQEAILFLPPTVHGRDPIRVRHVRPIAQILGWRHQRVLWRRLIAEKYPHVLAEFPGGRSSDEVLD